MDQKSSDTGYALGSDSHVFDRRQFLKLAGGATLAGAVLMTPRTVYATVSSSGSGNYIDYIEFTVNPMVDATATGGAKPSKDLAIADALKELDKNTGGLNVKIVYGQFTNPVYKGVWDPAMPSAPDGGGQGGSLPKAEVQVVQSGSQWVATVTIRKEPTATYTGQFNVFDEG